MSELVNGFHALPDEYQHIIRLAQETHRIAITPLQKITGGYSGAMVYLVSLAYEEQARVEHAILKLDRKNKRSSADEISRFQEVLQRSPEVFARQHIASMLFERIEQDGVIAIFYDIAGQSLSMFKTLSSFERQTQLEAIFKETYRHNLDHWNAQRSVVQAVHPTKILETWLTFRLKPGNLIEKFLESGCHLPPHLPGFLISGRVFPNPLAYAIDGGLWGNVRSIDFLSGLQHGDLNANNLLVKFAADGATLEGYYLIDFAMFKPDMPLLYDLRYLEMSYLTMQHAKTAFDKLLELILQVGESDIPHPDQVPIDVAGVCALFASTRHTFDAWVKLHHASLQDDLWGQYWLAGVAAGLSYCHKANLGFEERLAGLIFAAANLKRFASLFGMPLPAQAQQLIGPDDVRQGVPARLSSSPAGDKSMHKLPTQATPFIGRTAQLTAILAMVRDPAVRLITLLGPGGTGKTRLSLRLAESVSDDFAHGVAFVPLADDRDANQLVSRVAQVLEVREGGRPLLENIKDYVREKHLLLVLDNFEQLVSASPVIADLLASAPELKVITSSRIALNLQGEVEYPVPPLDLPGGDQELSLEALAGNEAVALFIERARANQPGFALTSSNQSAVVEICRRLDGLPLALELAAARIKLLTPQAILARLDDRLKLLTGGARDLPSRQQTLRNTLEWSYSLLSAEEKTLFARLAVFVGGFTLDAAERVCSLEGDIDVLEGLTALVNNSLLRQSSDAQGEPRFGMLETICAYALEHLQASGELPRMQEQHAAYYSNVVLEQAGMNLYTPHALSCLNLLTRENDNIRATLAWCLGSAEGAVLGANMLFPLEWFWYRRGLTLEGLDWSEKFLATPAVQADPQLHAITLSISGFMALWLGRQEDALSRLEKSLFIHQRIEDDFMIAALTMGTGVALLNMGRDAEAQPRLEMASRVMKELNQTYFQTLTVIHLGNVELGLGNFERARALHTQAEELARSIGEDWLLSFALNNLGEVARTQGQYEQAGKYYEECMALLEHTGDQGDQARFVHNLGYISQHKSDFLRAEKQFRKSLVMFRKLGNRRGMAECMAALAGLRARQGQAEWGAVMLSAAEQVIKSSGGAWWPADRVEVERNHTLIAAALDKATLLSAQMRGKAMGLEQALQFASSSV